MKIKVVTGDDSLRITSSIERAIKEGYKPKGELIATPQVSQYFEGRVTPNRSYIKYSQMMVKE